MAATLGLKKQKKHHILTLFYIDSDPDYDQDQDHEQYKNLNHGIACDPDNPDPSQAPTLWYQDSFERL